MSAAQRTRAEPAVVGHEQVRADRRQAYEYLPTDDCPWQRAFDAQRLLARTGRHRAVDVVELLTAVLAAEHGVTIVHYDADFETAAEVLEFAHRWVLPRGNVSGLPADLKVGGAARCPGATRYFRTRLCLLAP